MHQCPRVTPSSPASCWRENASCVKGKSSLSTDNTCSEGCGCRSASGFHPGRCWVASDFLWRALRLHVMDLFPGSSRCRTSDLAFCKTPDGKVEKAPAWPRMGRIPTGSRDAATPQCISVKKKNPFQSWSRLWFHLSLVKEVLLPLASCFPLFGASFALSHGLYQLLILLFLFS